MQQLFDAAMFGSTLRIMTPILLAALGGALCSRVGLFNVGLEGLVLIGAFSAIVGNYLFGNVLLAVLFSIIIVMLFSALFAFISINLKANAIVVGISLNFLAAGVTTFALRAIFDVKGAYYDKDMVGLPKWDIPLIKDIPWVGDVISGHSPLVYLGIVLVIALQFYLFKSVSGFRLRSVGGEPDCSAEHRDQGTRYSVWCRSDVRCVVCSGWSTVVARSGNDVYRRHDCWSWFYRAGSNDAGASESAWRDGLQCTVWFHGSIKYSSARILPANAFHIDAAVYCDAGRDVLFQRPYLCTGCTESGRKLALILNVYVRDSKRRRNSTCITRLNV